MTRSAVGAEADRAGPSHRVLAQAAEWYALLQSGDATDADRLRWRAWLDDAAEHAQAWRQVEDISQAFHGLQAAPDPRGAAQGLWEADARTRQRRRALSGLAAVAASCVLGWTAWQDGRPRRLLLANWADHRTGTGETREILLSDGTRVWLNTGSAFNQVYDARQRLLQLVAGEMLIETAPDARRPFVAETPHGSMQALGTRYTVWLDGDETLLAVYEGAVRVRNRAGDSVQIEAGRQLRYGAHSLGGIMPADAAREAWRRQVLIAQDISLAEVVAQLGRYRRGHLGVAPEVADLRVFGSFPLQDTDEVLDMLAKALPLRIQRILPWWVTIEPAGS